MKVLHIAPYACGRTFKQIIEQQEAGWDVTLIYGTTGHADLLHMVKKYRGWCSDDEIKNQTGFDVVVLHTTIATTHTAKLLPLPEDCRLVWDCHDYVTNEYQDRFDAVTCPSKGMAKHFDNSEVIYSKVPECIAPCIPHLGRVNACALVATIGVKPEWSNYSGISKTLEMPVFIYPSSDTQKGYYEDEFIMRNIPYTQLLTQLTRFEYGYAGAANERVSIHDCVTNKFWEYLAAGCEIITYNSKEMYYLLQSKETSGSNIYMKSEMNKMNKIYGA